MPDMTPSEIIRTVDILERESFDLQSQMDSDFSLYRLDEYKGDKSLDDSRKFTSNDPRNQVDLAMHLVRTASTRYQVNRPRAKTMDRSLDNMKELFIIGCMAQANERRERRLEPDVLEGIASQCFIRGKLCERVLLVREDMDGPNPAADQIMEDFLEISEMIPDIIPPEIPDNTRTIVEIDDWDPRNVFYEVGRDGLLWACHKTKKTRAQLKDEYELDDDQLPDRGLHNEQDPEYYVYDYLDKEENSVILENGLYLKEPTVHGMTRVPVVIRLVGPLPVYQAEGEDYSTEYGQSLYHANRRMFDQNNFMLSIMLELAARAIQAPLIYRSRDGSLALDSDPRVSGAEVSLSTQNEEDIVPIPPVEMTRETGIFLANVQQMVQRGGFSHLAHGEISQNLSGFAINSLRQGMEIPILPAIRAMSSGLKEMADLLCDAYATGDFDIMTLSGKLQDPTRAYFSEEITPDAVKDGGEVEVIIEPILPQDNAAKVQLARMVTEGAVPMVSMRFARENYLGLQDVDQIEREVFEQLADTASPVAMAMKLMNAAAEQGEYEKAELYWMEFQTQLYQKLLDLGLVQGALAQQGGAAEPPLPGLEPGPGDGGSNLSPDVLPSQAQGVPQGAPVPQQGPLVPPGTPRPGAQADPADFAALG